MSSVPINTDNFIAFAKTLDTQEITSRAGRSKFRVRVTGDKLEFIPLSTDKARMHQHRDTEKVLNQFNRTQSFVTTEYGDNGIRNATYILTLVAMYLKHTHAEPHAAT